MIVRLSGGMCNQLFMYAFGRSLSIRRNLPVKFHWRRSTWDYALDKFNVKVDLVDEPVYSETYDEKTFAFDYGVETTRPSTYYRGYWQSEKYFSDIKGLREEITLKDGPSAITVGIGKAYSERESVFVHVRRGDYTIPGTAAVHGNLGMDYYTKAIEYVREKVQNPKFYVFSDDPIYCKAMFPEFEIASFPGSAQQDDLYLMSKCRHGIGANSTFGWWGAWMGNNEGTYVFPQKWFQNETDTKDLIPDRWIRI